MARLMRTIRKKFAFTSRGEMVMSERSGKEWDVFFNEVAILD